MAKKIYVTPLFNKDFLKSELCNGDLISACREIESGNYDASLGGLLYKQRIARKGQGKSGGYRAIVGARIHDVFVFLFLFAKNEQDNISKAEKEALKKLAAVYLKPKVDYAKLEAMVADGSLIKIE